MNIATLKGIHLAIKSGMLAAEAIAEALEKGDTSEAGLARYGELFENSWAKEELWKVRNYRQAFSKGMFRGMFDFGVAMVTGGRGLGRAPWLARRPRDHPAPRAIHLHPCPKFNDTDSLDKLTDVYHSGAVHEEDQPAHLLVNDPSICADRCTTGVRQPLPALLPCRRVRMARGFDRGHHQRVELRALQNLRHRRPLREHRVGGARRRRRSQVHRHVSQLAPLDHPHPRKPLALPNPNPWTPFLPRPFLSHDQSHLPKVLPRQKVPLGRRVRGCRAKSPSPAQRLSNCRRASWKTSKPSRAFHARDFHRGQGAFPRVLLVGLGEADAVDSEGLRRAAAVAVQGRQRLRAARLAACTFPTGSRSWPVARSTRVCGTSPRALVLGAYEYQGAKAVKKDAKASQETDPVGRWYSSGFSRGAKKGLALADACNFTRELQNKSGNQLRPADMASHARKLASRSPQITCKVFDEAAMRKMGMGLFLSVSQGSDYPAKMIHLTYKPKGRSKGKISVVGKGLTFDAGGISIKPSAKMEEMRYDMSGGAAVLGLFHALADVGVPYEVHGIVGASENAINGKATLPGDVHKAMNGTTVEIQNTDAEGRLVLADCLTYAQKKTKPDTLLNLATLTGAVIVAVGHELTGIYPTNDSLRDTLIESGPAGRGKVLAPALVGGAQRGHEGGGRGPEEHRARQPGRWFLPGGGLPVLLRGARPGVVSLRHRRRRLERGQPRLGGRSPGYRDWNSAPDGVS